MPTSEPLDLRRDYFLTLRDEIRATKARIFIILMLGVVGAPLLALCSLMTDAQLLVMMAPMAVLLLLVLYLAEQNVLMRAGRYIRDHVEGLDADWERWVGKQNFRSAERQLFAMFVIIGLAFYVILLVPAVQLVLAIDTQGVQDYETRFLKYGISVLYVTSTVWALITIIRFWHGAVSTSD
ncbi:MAG: hypothetical protein AAGE65_08100 [Planctomycetota bacterium]